MEQSQPTPTDIDYSLERYNLIWRAYWVIGVGENYVIDGKVSSLNSFLTPDSEYYEQEYGSNGYSVGDGNSWLADVIAHFDCILSQFSLLYKEINLFISKEKNIKSEIFPEN